MQGIDPRNQGKNAGSRGGKVVWIYSEGRILDSLMKTGQQDLLTAWVQRGKEKNQDDPKLLGINNLENEAGCRW